jgi:electron transport complex protein RnfB
MVSAIFIVTALGIAMGVMLGLASKYLAVEGNPLQAEIEELLPGSQCGQCGYPRCSPAAEAVANGEAPVTMCPPGGKALAESLAERSPKVLSMIKRVSDLVPRLDRRSAIEHEVEISALLLSYRETRDNLHTMLSDLKKKKGK